MLGLVVIGLILAVWPPLGGDELMELGQRAGNSPLFLGGVIALMVVLYTFGLPGTVGLWVIAPFSPPLIATGMMLVASTSGAVGAYFFSAFLRREWQPKRAPGKVFRLLERRGDVLTQTALRMLPGFPHSIVNFAAGVLRLPLATFLFAALVGLSVKWTVYTHAIHGITEAVASDRAVSLSSLWPLFVLTALLLAGGWYKQRLS